MTFMYRFNYRSTLLAHLKHSAQIVIRSAGSSLCRAESLPNAPKPYPSVLDSFHIPLAMRKFGREDWNEASQDISYSANPLIIELLIATSFKQQFEQEERFFGRPTKPVSNRGCRWIRGWWHDIECYVLNTRITRGSR